MRPIVLLAAAALLAACGSGDDGELSVEEYRKRANEICAQVTDRAEEFDLPRSIRGMADYIDRLLRLSRPYDRRFRELDPPAELAEQHDRAVEVSDKLNEEVEEMADRLRSAPDPAVALRRQVDRLLPTIRQGDEVFGRLGLDECLAGPQILESAEPS